MVDASCPLRQRTKQLGCQPDLLVGPLATAKIDWWGAVQMKLPWPVALLPVHRGLRTRSRWLLQCLEQGLVLGATKRYYLRLGIQILRSAVWRQQLAGVLKAGRNGCKEPGLLLGG